MKKRDQKLILSENGKVYKEKYLKIIPVGLDYPIFFFFTCF